VIHGGNKSVTRTLKGTFDLERGSDLNLGRTEEMGFWFLISPALKEGYTHNHLKDRQLAAAVTDGFQARNPYFYRIALHLK